MMEGRNNSDIKKCSSQYRKSWLVTFLFVSAVGSSLYYATDHPQQKAPPQEEVVKAVPTRAVQINKAVVQAQAHDGAGSSRSSKPTTNMNTASPSTIRPTPTPTTAPTRSSSKSARPPFLQSNDNNKNEDKKDLKVAQHELHHAVQVKATTMSTAAAAVRTIPAECLPHIKKGLVDIKTHGRYIRAPARTAPYDHTCFLMKSRYNCARAANATNINDDHAYQWKFVLQQPPQGKKAFSNNATSSANKYCDIGKIVEDLGGPAAILGGDITGGNNNTNKKTIGLLGDSYLRQIFEALACKYQHQITNLRLQQHSPDISMAGLKKRKGRKFTTQELGDPILLADMMMDMDMDMDTDNTETAATATTADMHNYKYCGAMGQEFYRVPVDHIQVMPHCADNIALAEYGDSNSDGLTVFYTFRPWLMEDLADAMDRMAGPNVTQALEYIAYNVNSKQLVEPQLRPSLSHPKLQWFDFSTLLPSMKQMQTRDALHWFGADNPWITSPPDDHACMPGSPDDEVAILLFILLFDLDGFA